MYDPRVTSGASHSLWVKNIGAEAPDLEAEVTSGEKVDVIVVGAGITGLSTAYHLAVAGMSVLVIDRGGIARGETSRSTAHACSALDDRFYVLEQLHGQDGARLAAMSHEHAISSIEAIANREGIGCGFARIDGYLFAAEPQDDKHREQLEKELAAARRAGLEVDPILDAPLSFEAGTVLRFKHQAQLDPLAYSRGLAHAIHGHGGRFVLDARVVKLDDAEPITVHIEDGRTFRADFAVIATNTPIIDIVTMHTKQAAYRSYVMAFAIEKGSIPRALFWDTAEPYHYVRLAGDDDVLIVGGEDHKVGQSSEPEQAWVRLEAWTRTHFPQATRVLERWSGQVWEPVDSLAFIGQNPTSSERVLIATGDSGNGITHGALAGHMLSERILGRKTEFDELYEPSRKMVQPRSAGALVRENINVAISYGAYITSAIDKRIEPHELEPGEGMIVRRGLKRIAQYRDEAGAIHECHAVCTHLGGPVHWNAAERSWDCPCHGARYDPMGRVLTGPATRDLHPIDHDAPASMEAPAEAEPIVAKDPSIVAAE
jgi:glycine/D-amino acid oxidase-like deaminating enzyme/nitrite reductase/ring-hydroxylating ferredoxin subunit